MNMDVEKMEKKDRNIKDTAQTQAKKWTRNAYFFHLASFLKIDDELCVH